MIHNNPYCKIYLKEFDFPFLAKFFLSEEFLVQRQKINTNCIEILLYILFENTNLGIFHEITTPEVIPLLVSMMGSFYSNFSEYLISCIEDPHNAVYFSMSNIIEIIDNRIKNCISFELMSFMMKILEKTISHNATPSGIKKLLITTKKLEKSKQYEFFKALRKSVNKAFIACEDSAGLNSMINMTKYL